MKLERYPLIEGETSMVYEFISEGIHRRIAKIIIYSKTNLSGFYNLGFGDKDSLTGDIDDNSITNNGDSKKVLATVASTIYLFTDKYKEAYIFAEGSTKGRTRLYRIGISNNLETIIADFDVYGLINEEWLPFKKGIEYEAFL